MLRPLGEGTGAAALRVVLLADLVYVLVVASLVMGVFYMTKEGPEARQKSLKMMKMRVYLQGLALLLAALAFMAGGK